jgi:hypothetical protein
MQHDISEDTPSILPCGLERCLRSAERWPLFVKRPESEGLDMLDEWREPAHPVPLPPCEASRH